MSLAVSWTALWGMIKVYWLYLILDSLLEQIGVFSNQACEKACLAKQHLKLYVMMILYSL